MDRFNTRITPDSKDEWLTPPEIIEALGPFDLDPCAPIRRPWRTARRHYTVEDDGLSAPWEGRVWLNPPYGRETFKWMARMAEHRSGVALIFARTETKGFQREIFSKAHSVFFFAGRLFFYHVTGERAPASANAPSVLVSYSEEDTDSISRSGLKGRLLFVGRQKAQKWKELL